MKALRLHGARDLRLEEVEDPPCSEDSVLIRVTGCAICGSDLRTFNTGTSGHGLQLPRIMGHEIAGIVHRVGAHAPTDLQPGEAVVVGAVVSCGRCVYCARGQHNRCLAREVVGYQFDGGFAEYMQVPSQALRIGNVVRIPHEFPPTVACLAEPLSCALNGQHLSRVGPGDTVLIIGAGPLGLMHVQIARLRGATKVIVLELSAERRALALHVGADEVIDPQGNDVTERLLALTDGKLADVVIIAAPSPDAAEQALLWTAKGGRINVFAGLPRGQEQITLDLNTLHYREITVHGTSDSAAWHLQLALELMVTGRINLQPLVTHTISLDEAVAFFQNGPVPSLIKTVVVP